MKNLKILCIFVLLTFNSSLIFAQDIPQNISYTRVYEFIDELATDRVITVFSTVKPYSRNFIAEKLKEASNNTEKMSKRQIAEIEFFMRDYALELDTMPKAILNWTDKKTFSLSLLQPAFHYKNKIFKARITPILGMDLIMNSKGLITKRAWGAEFQADIVNHISVWGSIRDLSFNGNRLKESVFSSKRYGALLNPSPSASGQLGLGYPIQFLTNSFGYEYDLNNNYGGDFTESRGGIKIYADWGSIGLVKDNIVWGDNNYCSNIISGNAPSFPMITLNLKPCKWFELNYIHGFLVSNVLDSSYYYTDTQHENNLVPNYRPKNKYIAANLLTIKPIRGLDFSFGNSIIYAERSVQAAYLIPIAFYKGLDKVLTRGVRTENQNSQIFLNISSRNIKHLHLYASIYFDEIQFKRFKRKNPSNNPFSYKVGFNVTNFPLKNLAFAGEFTRTNIINYKHSIEELTWASNGINLGHYLGDNSQDIYFALHYKPIKGLNMKAYFVNSTKYRDFDYFNGNIGAIISQKPFNQKSWTNQILALNVVYEPFNNIYAHINLQYNNAKGYDLTANSGAVEGENCLTAQQFLDKFTPKFYQGKNITFTCGLTFGF